MSAAFLARLKHTAIPVDDLQSVIRLASSTRTYPARANILDENTPASLLLVLEGWAASCKYMGDGRRQISALYLPGDICNLDDFFSRKNSATVSAINKCIVSIIPVERARALAETNPGVQNLLWRLTLFRSAISTQWLFNIGQRSTRERLAHLICELHVRLDAIGLVTGWSFALPLTQQDFGECLGVSSVHINRTFQCFRNEGLIEFNERRLVLREFNALRDASEFDPKYLRI